MTAAQFLLKMRRCAFWNNLVWASSIPRLSKGDDWSDKWLVTDGKKVYTTTNDVSTIVVSSRLSGRKADYFR